jgi:hypothetical protein
MKTYRIDFCRTKRNGEENLLIMELPRERFTRREFKDCVIAQLFELAGEGSRNKMLSAYVSCDGRKVLTFRCDTKVDGSTIDAHVYVARPREIFHKLRTMTIAA